MWILCSNFALCLDACVTRYVYHVTCVNSVTHDAKNDADATGTQRLTHPTAVFHIGLHSVVFFCVGVEPNGVIFDVSAKNDRVYPV